MSKLAFLFPGQASQYCGMGRDLAANFPESKAVFDEADSALGFSITQTCFEGSEEALKLTENTQPAILTVSTAAYRALAEKGIVPDFVAGHSLGEYSALVAAGGVDFSAAVKLVRARGKYMQEAVPAGQGAMAAILGLSPTEVADICKKAAENEVVSPANLNSPEQTVISGSAAAVKRAVEIASQSGAKRAVILPVSAPFHCALMMPAQQRLERGPARHAIQRAENSADHQRGRPSHHHRRRSPRRAHPPGHRPRTLARFRARNDRIRRHRLRRSRPRQSPDRPPAPNRSLRPRLQRRRFRLAASHNGKTSPSPRRSPRTVNFTQAYLAGR